MSSYLLRSLLLLLRKPVSKTIGKLLYMRSAASQAPFPTLYTNRNPSTKTPQKSVRIFGALIAPFVLFTELHDLSGESLALETCLRAQRLPESGNTDPEIINST